MFLSILLVVGCRFEGVVVVLILRQEFFFGGFPGQVKAAQA